MAKFFDVANLNLKAGKGGDGIVAFRREKFVPKGGPSGGDGGRGGSIYVVGDNNKSTLMDLRYKKTIVAPNGQNGMTDNKHGKNGESIFINVPVGTIVSNLANNKILAEIIKDKQTIKILNGGAGGKGNARFSTSVNRVPKLAERGFEGGTITAKFELMLLADCGLIGLPNAGKSTLLKVTTNANPIVADYPFTTINPQLGVVKVNKDSFVMADLPGLIEGAGTGKGLGYDFLKHVERCKLLVHLIDVGSENQELTPFERFNLINNELKQYDKNFQDVKQIVVATKMDLPSADHNLKQLRKQLQNIKIYAISAMTHYHLSKLINVIFELIKTDTTKLYSARQMKLMNENNKNQDYNFEKADDSGVEIKREAKNNIFIVSGFRIVQLLRRYYYTTDEEWAMFFQIINKMKLVTLLKRFGAKNSATIVIGDYKFKLDVENNKLIKDFDLIEG